MSVETKLIKFIAKVFKVDVKVDKSWGDYTGKRVIVWSKDVSESGDDIEILSDGLYFLKEYFNLKGYDLVTQDDPDYFGGALIPRQEA